MTISYSETYESSLALIIGINKYKKASPLQYAVKDAEEVAKVLVKSFNFDQKKITLLLDEEATKANITQSFLSYVNTSNDNDRIFFFFAGHGHTCTGYRGEAGYLRVS